MLPIADDQTAFRMVDPDQMHFPSGFEPDDAIGRWHRNVAQDEKGAFAREMSRLRRRCGIRGRLGVPIVVVEPPSPESQHDDEDAATVS